MGDWDCGGPLEGIVGSDKLADQGGSTGSQHTSWLLGG